MGHAEGHGPPTQSWLTPAPADSAGGYFRSRRHVRKRTPRKHENAGPVLLGPVSHRARLCVERFAEGLGGTPAPADSAGGYFRSRLHVRKRTPRKHENGFAAPSSRVTDGGRAAVKTQRNNTIRAAMSRKSAIVIA